MARLENGKVIFLDRGFPGETVLAQISQRARRYNRGKTLEILSESPDRIAASCRHFQECGGCSWQDLAYPAQLLQKKKLIVDALQRLGGFENIPVADPLPAESNFFYRNKMEFSFNRDQTTEAGFTLGLHHRGEFARVFDISECLLQSKLSNEIVIWLRDFVRQVNSEDNSLEAYDVVNHTGFMRFLMIRQSLGTGEVMINIVTTLGDFPHAQRLVDSCLERFPQVTTIVRNMNDRKSNIAYGDEQEILHGPGFIVEVTLGKRFRVYANSFLQTNSSQTETLYSLALAKAGLTGTERVFDLYCGAGTIGICAAEQAAEIIGIELEPTAVRAAIENASDNNVDNIGFIEGGVRETIRERFAELGEADVLFIDPPRAGMHPRAVFHAARLGARRIVYISCNPSTFARDAELFARVNYRLVEVSPVDMFPHTAHIELVSVFVKIPCEEIAESG